MEEMDLFHINVVDKLIETPVGAMQYNSAEAQKLQHQLLKFPASHLISINTHYVTR